MGMLQKHATVNSLAQAHVEVKRVEQIKSLVVLSFVVDYMIAAIPFWAGATEPLVFRWSRWLRPVYMILTSRELRRWAQLIMASIPSTVGLAVLLFIVLSIYAIVGVLLIGPKTMYENYPVTNGQKLYNDDENFSNYVNAMVVMYVLMTAENYPTITYAVYQLGKWEVSPRVTRLPTGHPRTTNHQPPTTVQPPTFHLPPRNVHHPPFTIPPYQGNLITAAFFVSFMCVVTFFLANLALPRIYMEFRRFRDAAKRRARFLSRSAMLMCFAMLDFEKRGLVEYKTFSLLVLEVSSDPRLPRVGSEARPTKPTTKHTQQRHPITTHNNIQQHTTTYNPPGAARAEVDAPRGVRGGPPNHVQKALPIQHAVGLADR